jgi:hypothetical protein
VCHALSARSSSTSFFHIFIIVIFFIIIFIFIVVVSYGTPLLHSRLLRCRRAHRARLCLLPPVLLQLLLQSLLPCPIPVSELRTNRKSLHGQRVDLVVSPMVLDRIRFSNGIHLEQPCGL